VLLSDIESYRVQFPDIVADTIAAGVRASASLPLYRSDGTVLGALAFAWTDTTVFNPKTGGCAASRGYPLRRDRGTGGALRRRP
jgi:hypothetical protein